MQFSVEVKPDIAKNMNILVQMIEELTGNINKMMVERIKNIDHLNAVWREACKDHILAGGQNFTKEQIVNFISNEQVYVTLENGVGTWNINIPPQKEDAQE